MSLVRSGHVMLLLIPLLVPKRAISQADPNYYDFYPSSVMSLGYGFSPNDVSLPKVQCVSISPRRLETGTLATGVEAVLVRDEQQLKSALKVDAKIDASFLVFKGSTEFNYSTKGLFESKSITVVVRAWSEYGRLGLKDPQLLVEPRKLLDAGKIKEFVETCGSRLVAIERRGSSVGAIITITDVSSQTESIINANMEAAGGWGPLRASAKTAFRKELAEAGKHGRVEVQVVATGGEGFGALSDLVSSLITGNDPLPALENSISGYVKSFTFENAVPIGFHVTRMLGLGTAAPDLWTEQKERKLRVLVTRYRNLSEWLSQAGAVLDGHDPRREALSKAQLEEVRAAADKAESYLDAIAAAHSKCKASSSTLPDCDLPTGEVPAATLLPPLPNPPTGSLRVVADGQTWDQRKSRPVIYPSTPEGLNSDIINRIRRVVGDSVQRAQIALLLEGAFMTKAVLEFNGTPVDSLDIDPSLSTRLIVLEDREAAKPVRRGEPASRPAPPKVDMSLGQAIGELKDADQRAHRSGSTGSFAIRVRDRFDRETRFRIADVSWTILSSTPGAYSIRFNWVK